MPAVGLDIGSYAIKLLVGKPSGEGLKVQLAQEIPNPIGAVFPDSPEKRQKMVDTLRQLFTETKVATRDIRVGLPESAVSTKVVTMPSLSDAELASAIQWQVEQNIPIPLEEMQYEYSVLHRSAKEDPNQEMNVLMIGTKKVLVQSLADLFLDADLEVMDMETDTMALLRIFEKWVQPEESAALLHIGSSASVMVLVAKGTFQYVHTIPTGGVLFTRSIERGIGLDVDRAESYKRTYGLLANQLEGKVRQVLSPVVDSLMTEVQKSLRFFATQNPGEQMSKVYVSGGSLYLPDLLPYLSQGVSLEIIPIELAAMKDFEWQQPVKQDSRFVIAAGLAMKEV